MGENSETTLKNYLSLSDIASYLSGGRLFIGLTGVQNVRYLKEIVTSLHPKRIVECIDMDCRTNPQVQRAQSKIQAICTPLCEEYKRFFWPPEQKGIDDFLLFKKLKKEHEEKIRKEQNNVSKL